jgi:nucleotide-binding universal stress UspA family protein
MTVVATFNKLLGVWRSTSKLLPFTTNNMLDLSVKNIEEYLKNLENDLEKHQVKTFTNVYRGNPAKMISKVADSLNIGLIVIGTHKKRGTDAFWSGSITPLISRYCRQPLLLVPANHMNQNKSGKTRE